MPATHVITAVATPLTEDEQLDRTALESHLTDQFDHGISGLLVAGTMGMMQLLTDSTYRQLVEQSAAWVAGRGELLVGVGDTSFARTRARIRMVEAMPIDGVVVLAPFFVHFSQAELIDYYRTLADASRKPVYLYDLPVVTGTKIEVETVLELARHPNIRGIKCSDHFETIRPVIDAIGDRFRVIVAQPYLVDVLLRAGVREHLDGIYGLAPHWTMAIVRAAERNDWQSAAAAQRDLATLLRFLRSFSAPLLSAFSLLLNARGIPGVYAPRPMRRLTDTQRDALFQAEIVRKLLAGSACRPDR